MKGVILAGGKGTRLWPLTQITNKHLLPVGRIPMIEFPLQILRQMDLEQTSIVMDQKHFFCLEDYLSHTHPYENYVCHSEHNSEGTAASLLLAQNSLKGSKIVVYLGDNIFEDDFSKVAKYFQQSDLGGMLFLKKVDNPEMFGVAEINGDRVISVEEKPSSPKTNYAITGLSFYDETIFERLQGVRVSARGELELPDAMMTYIEEGRMGYTFVKGFWKDAGTHESIKECVDYVSSLDLDNPEKFNIKPFHK